MNPVTISVVTINRNNAAGLRRTIESVISQRGVSIQYIVIDGASTDGSAEIIRLNEQDIFYQLSEPDRGIYHAQNKGLAKASSEYIIFLNSGDVFLTENSLAELAKNAGKADIVYGNIMMKNSSQPAVLYQYPSKPDVEFWKHDTISHNTAIIKTSLLKAAGGYDEQVAICADWKFFVIARYKMQASFLHVAVPVIEYNMDGLSSKAENMEKMKEEHERIWRELFPSPGILKRLLMKLGMIPRMK